MPATTSLRSTLFTTATTGTSRPVDCSQLTLLTIYVTGFNTISTGTLLIEEADYNPLSDAPFAGTWAQVDSIDLTAVTGGGTSGKRGVTRLPSAAPGPRAWALIRGRFSANVTGTGGSVTVVLRGE